MASSEEEQDKQSESLKAPDLSELMSEIISESSKQQRLVFVEYDPATQAFYDHVGLSDDDANKVMDTLEKSKKADNCDTWKCFLEELCKESGIPTEKIKPFIERLAQMAESLLLHLFDLIPGIIDENNSSERQFFLACIARCNDCNTELGKAWLKELEKEKIYALFHWLIQRIPQPKTEGGAGKHRVHGWIPVDNSDIDGFLELAGLEYFFGIRKKEGIHHARFNVFLETGEYVGQMIAFTDSSEQGEKDILLNDAFEAARLVRQILSEVRQARYMDKILSGGEGGKLEHVLVRYLTILIPVSKFLVRNIKRDKNKNLIDGWKNFFSEAMIYCHKPIEVRTAKDCLGHFKQAQYNNEEDSITAMQSAISNLEDGKDKWEEGFVSWNENNEVSLAFSVLTTSSSDGGGLAVIALVDKDFFPANMFKLELGSNFEQLFDTKNVCNDAGNGYNCCSPPEQNGFEYPVVCLPKDLITRHQQFTDAELLQRYLKMRLSTTLSVVLEPRHPLWGRLSEAAATEGKTYCEQFGTAIYGRNYLDINNLINLPDNLYAFLRIVKYTQTKLTDTLYEPRGYLAIARVIFHRFFCNLWKYFEFEGDPSKGKTDGENMYTPLGSLVREALDFEDTLRLEGGYREHFVHSYHVFLLGIYLIRELDLLHGMEDEKAKEILAAWFLTSMYHDIGYPIQKMGDIAKKYLERLNVGGKNGAINKDIDIEINIGYGRLLGSGLFGARLRRITDSYIDVMFPQNANSVRGKNIDNTIKTINSLCNTDINLELYKEGLKHTFFHYCLSLALEHGEHGIISALLFDRAARSSLLNKCGSEINGLGLREKVSIAILAHHMFDRNGVWEDHYNIPQNEGECPLGNSPQEIAESIGWDPAWFFYDLKNNDREFHLLCGLLVLCDSLSQWGRTEDANDKKLACLRVRKNDDNYMIVCYPKGIDIKEMEKFYSAQLERITGPSRERFISIGSKRPEKDGKSSCKTAEKCHECTIGTYTISIPLCEEPRWFVSQKGKSSKKETAIKNNDGSEIMIIVKD